MTDKKNNKGFNKHKRTHKVNTRHEQTKEVNFVEMWAKNLSALFLIGKQLEVLDSLFYTKAKKEYDTEYKINKDFWATIKYSLIKGVAIDLANLCYDEAPDRDTGKPAFSLKYWEWYFAGEVKEQKKRKNPRYVTHCKAIIKMIKELRKSEDSDLQKLRRAMAHHSIRRNSFQVTFSELREIYNRNEKLLEEIVKYVNVKNTGDTNARSDSETDVNSIEDSTEYIMHRLLKG